MKILILGSKGMLGQMAYGFFSAHYETLIFDKKYSLLNRNEFVNEIKEFGDCIIINCIGRIKQKFTNAMELYQTNSILPFDLINGIGKGQILVQPSSDCVFSGNSLSHYLSGQRPDAIDDYGWSKALGEEALLERSNCYIIRVSIIGPDNSNNPKGLLSWFLSSGDENELNGFTDHWWNGITTLEWCKKVESIIMADQERERTGKIIQLGTEEKYNKYELLNYFQKVFESKYLIRPTSSGNYTNRCLLPDFSSTNIISQLIELKENCYVQIN